MKTSPLKAEIKRLEIQDIASIDAVEELSKILAKEIDIQIIGELKNPYSHFNDPNGTRKNAKKIRELREKKLKRLND